MMMSCSVPSPEPRTTVSGDSDARRAATTWPACSAEVVSMRSPSSLTLSAKKAGADLSPQTGLTMMRGMR